MDRIPEELLARPVTGAHLVPGTLRDQLGAGPTLLVFLRHLGCIFCRESISELREAVEADIGLPGVLFFSQASPRESRAFLRRYWPDGKIVSDPELVFYDGLGIGRASWLQALGPRVLVAQSRAKKKGFENGPASGDIFRMPGAMVVEGERIVWAYEPKHAADHPDFRALPSQLRGLAAR